MQKFSEIETRPNFSKVLPFDDIQENYTRQVTHAVGSFVETKKVRNPRMVHYSTEFLKEYRLKIDNETNFLEVFSGVKKFNNFKPFAMCYGGHQFGNWAGQLGDGRAINIAETILNSKPVTFQLKGAGPTPYSRGSDGLAVLRSSIREYLCSEAMFHLGVPTTRALSIALSGDFVTRDILYNGNPAEEKGAIVCRVAPSFIRFGNFEIFTSRNELDELKKLVDFTIRNHFPELGEPSVPTYLDFFSEVANRTAKMIVDWQRVGFVHGVMNTDNMSILGLTIDYGPYGWLEDFDPAWTPNTTDSSQKRYRYGNQPNIALWNVTQLANALFPLINDAEPLNVILKAFKDRFERDYHTMLLSKLGLFQLSKEGIQLSLDLHELLKKSEMDMTIFYRNLSKLKVDEPHEHLSLVEQSSYFNATRFQAYADLWKSWLNRYAHCLKRENVDLSLRIGKMNKVNPKYVLRNWMSQMAIDEAEKDNFGLIDELYKLLISPYDEQPEMEKWFSKRPEWAKEKIGCSMLSCSS